MTGTAHRRRCGHSSPREPLCGVCADHAAGSLRSSPESDGHRKPGPCAHDRHRNYLGDRKPATATRDQAAPIRRCPRKEKSGGPGPAAWRQIAMVSRSGPAARGTAARRRGRGGRRGRRGRRGGLCRIGRQGRTTTTRAGRINNGRTGGRRRWLLGSGTCTCLEGRARLIGDSGLKRRRQRPIGIELVTGRQQNQGGQASHDIGVRRISCRCRAGRKINNSCGCRQSGTRHERCNECTGDNVLLHVITPRLIWFHPACELSVTRRHKVNILLILLYSTSKTKQHHMVNHHILNRRGKCF